MRPEEYRKIIKNLETHFAEFKVSCNGSQMFADEDKRVIENQFNGATAHYDQLVVQLPVYSQYMNKYQQTTEAFALFYADDDVKIVTLSSMISFLLPFKFGRHLN